MASRKKNAETKRATVRFTLQGRKVTAPAGMTVLNAMQILGHDYLRGCGCRMGDCGECKVYYRLPDSDETGYDHACELRVSPGLEVMSVPFQWNIAYRRARGD